MNIPAVLLSIGFSALATAADSVSAVARSGPINRGFSMPDAITYALFGGGLIAIAVLRRRGT